MAKESMKAREVKRAKLNAKYAAKRKALLDAGDYEALQKQRDANWTVATDTFGPFYENYYGITYAQIFIHIASRKVWLFGI